MSLIEAKDRAYIACPKCRQNIVWPEGLSVEQKRQIAGVSRRSPVEGARHAHAVFALDLREAKALAMHITQESGCCHRCGAPVVGELSICAKCRSANLDW